MDDLESDSETEIVTNDLELEKEENHSNILDREKLYEKKEEPDLEEMATNGKQTKRTPKLMKRKDNRGHQYGTASRISEDHLIAQQMTLENEILGSINQRYLDWLKDFLKAEAALELAELHRRIGSTLFDPTMAHAELQPSRDKLYAALTASPSSLTLPVDGIFEFQWNAATKVAILTLNTRKSQMRPDREMSHVMSSRHEKLADGENATHGLPLTHQPVFVSLDFLADQDWNTLIVRSQRSAEKIRFPHGFCMVPSLSKILAAKKKRLDNVTVIFSEVFVTNSLLEQIAKIPYLTKLTFDRCALLEPARFGDVNWLNHFTWKVFPLNKKHQLNFDWETLPMLKELEIDTRYRLIYKKYIVVEEMPTLGGTPPTISVQYNSLTSVNIRENSDKKKLKLRTLSLSIFHQDLFYLAGKKEEVLNVWFKCFEPKVLKMSTTLRDEDPSLFFMEDSFDVNMSPYCLNLVEHILTNCLSDFDEDAKDVEDRPPPLMNSQLEGLRYKTNSILNVTTAHNLWIKILLLGPQIFSANAYFFIAMGIVPPYRDLAKAMESDDSNNDPKADQNLEKHLRGNYQITMRDSMLNPLKTKTFLVPIDEAYRRIFLLMGGSNSGRRIPIICMQVSPFMDPNLWLPEENACTVYLGTFSKEYLNNTILVLDKVGGQHVVPKESGSMSKCSLHLEDLVTDQELRMPYSTSSGFPLTYLVFWKPSNAGCYPTWFREVKSSSDLEDVKRGMIESAKLMEIGNLGTRNDGEPCGGNFTLNPIRWFWPKK